MTYKTPGVFVEEVSLLPPSVAQVETAIPAFIGYTEKAEAANGDDLTLVPTRIKSLLDYRTYFGSSHNQPLSVVLSDVEPFDPVSVGFNGEESPYRMYHALQMYFDNGGGPCYIVSVGDYGTNASSTKDSLDKIDDYNELKKGLDSIRKVDEITLIVFPEADKLSETEMSDLYKDTLSQCADLQDRFGLFDVRSDDTDGSIFRNGIGVNNLSYGACYYPYINTIFAYPYISESVTFSHSALNAFDGKTMESIDLMAKVLENQSQVFLAKEIVNAAASINPVDVNKEELLYHYKQALNATQKAIQNANEAFDVAVELDETFESEELEDATSGYDDVVTDAISSSSVKADIKTAIDELSDACDDSKTAIINIVAKMNTETGVGAARNANISTYYTNAFVAKIKSFLNGFKITMPPAATIAGVYGKVDSSRGVWKAPANVSLNNVSGPAVKIDQSDNDLFNVHPTGKSINVIRAFTGKGTLVWGARTLDGNSLEWKYISVRRFFIMVEESIKKASEQFVFEPNDANTWVKVKAMIENFLILQWRAGALMGSKPKEAFFVNVGLGVTMTQEDILNGNMIIEIGLAAVRPAEFIILRFSHKMLEA